MSSLARLKLQDYENPRIARLRPNLWGLGFSLMKLLPARFMLDRAEEAGELRHSGHIVETTSGTFGLALAMLAVARQYRLSLVTADSLIDEVFERRLKLLGAAVIVTEDANKTGNQQERLKVVETILAKDPSAFWPNQYANPYNPMSYASVASIIIRKIGYIDRLVASVGSGGSISGTAQFLRIAFPELEVVAVDTFGSVLFGQPAAPRRLRGMGNSIIPQNLRHDTIDHVHWVGADLAHQATLALYRKHGIFAGPTSGAAFLVADWFARRDPQLRTVFLLPDEGYRYLSTVYAVDPLGDANLPSETTSAGPSEMQFGRAGNDSGWSSFVWSRRSLSQVTAGA